MQYYYSIYCLFVIYLCMICPLTPSISEEDDIDEQEEEPVTTEDSDLEGNIGVLDVIVDVENTTYPVDRSDEEWVPEAVLDVAYYLRAHKFNDFDRRYLKDTGIDQSFQFKYFPNPPLRYLHWEVYKYCEKGFYECLAYLHDTVIKADLVRSMDTNVIMSQRHWEFPRNAKSIEKVEKECQRLKSRDWRDADPFKGPLERFQWRVSASYYMCSFSMQDFSPLIMFGERCDNFAACLEGKTGRNGDPRADDSEPYRCALYSFCPDVCCPTRFVQDEGECIDLEENPCGWHPDREHRQCSFKRELNRDLVGMALNQWNVSCFCEPGFQWESAFGMCIDVDECSTGTHNCSATQTCLNLQGRYACVCAWGHVNRSGDCVPIGALDRALDALHRYHHPSTVTPPAPLSLLSFLFKWTLGLFFHSKSTPSTQSSLTINKTD